MKFNAKKIEKKLRAAADLFKMALETKKFQLKKKYPDKSERELNLLAYALIEKESKSNTLPPEQIIIKDLALYRLNKSGKHLKDIRGILAETEVDQNYLNQWISKLGLTREWEKV